MRLLQVWNCWILITAYTSNKKKKKTGSVFIETVWGTGGSQHYEIHWNSVIIWCFILQHGNYLSHLIVTRNRRILTFSLSEISVPFFAILSETSVDNCKLCLNCVNVFKTDVFKDDSHFGKFLASQN